MFKSDKQGNLFTADHEYKAYVGRETFYGFLAEHGYRLFPDEMFESLYCENNGRPCASPCMLTKVMLLQMYDGCSDAEAVARASYDLRWKVALGVELDERPFAKSTLQLHRARLHLANNFDELLAATNQEARRLGILKRAKLTVAVDTTPVYGRGAVKDTYNLVADGIKALCRALGALENRSAKGWAHSNDFRRYFESSSVKGMAEIDWSNDEKRRIFLASLVADVDRILLCADRALAHSPKTGTEPMSAAAHRKAAEEAARRKSVKDAAGLLRQLVTQDVERSEAGAKIREGVAKDRVPSVTDPEIRHGRKSASKRFDGHKAGIAVDTDSQMITAVEVSAGNSADQDSAMDLVEASEKNTGLEVDKTIGDCAYGSGETRQEFADAERELVAKVPSPPKDEPCHKWQFDIDVEKGRVTCPAGHTTEDYQWARGRNGEDPAVKQFLFPKVVCDNCPLAAVCVGKSRHGGRSIYFNQHEPLLQAARKHQATEQFRQEIKDRQVVEHRLARLVQLGIRQARYFGRSKTRLQVVLAAVVANLTLLGKVIRYPESITLGPAPAFGPSARLSAVLFALLHLTALALFGAGAPPHPSSISPRGLGGFRWGGLCPGS